MLTSKTMFKSETDEVMEHVRLEMTPARKRRLTAAASAICDLVIAKTENPAEGMAALQLATTALSDRFNFNYKGLVILCDREMPESRCYQCGKKLDRTAHASGDAPEPSDVTICAYCGAVMVFSESLHAVKPDEERLKDLLSDPAIVGIVAAVRAKSSVTGKAELSGQGPVSRTADAEPLR